MGRTQVPGKGTLFLLHIWHSSYYFYKPDDHIQWRFVILNLATTKKQKHTKKKEKKEAIRPSLCTCISNIMASVSKCGCSVPQNYISHILKHYCKNPLFLCVLRIEWQRFQRSVELMVRCSVPQSYLRLILKHCFFSSCPMAPTITSIKANHIW